ncbi:MAG: endonuclease III [Candidatus Omnitrophota bacterium]|jgi:endonuclease-3
MRTDKVFAVRDLLFKRFGRLKFRTEKDAVGELVKTILSQNTSDITSLRAFGNLKRRFKDWESLRRSGLPSIRREIMIAGLSNIKAPRIKGALNEIAERRGSLSLGFLSSMSLGEGYRFLRSIKGIGPKTAAIVLLFSFRKPIMPVDTHIFRIMKRLGLIGPGTTREKAQEYLTSASPEHAIREFHVHLIMLGREVCTAREPKCQLCNLKALCKYYGDEYGRRHAKDRKKRI